MLQGVKCLVSNCSHWQQGNKCDASTIEVTLETGVAEACKSAETNCRTFKAK